MICNKPRQVRHDLLNLMSTQPSFYNYTAKEYDEVARDGQIPPYDIRLRAVVDDDYEPVHEPRYVRGSENILLNWKIHPWLIMTDSEMDKMETMLPPEAPIDWGDLEEELSPQQPTPEKLLHYSGTSSAIRFLDSLSVQQRAHIRNIVIEEIHQSVGDQPCHANGLIPFCKENPQLHVEIRVDIWKVLIWDSWHERSKRIYTEHVFCNLCRWLREALFVSADMPSGQYRLNFYSQDKDLVQHLWYGARRMASIIEAAEHIHRMNPGPEKPAILYGGLQPDFPDLVKSVITGRIPVECDFTIGDFWDLDQVIYEFQHSTPPLVAGSQIVNFNTL